MSLQAGQRRSNLGSQTQFRAFGIPFNPRHERFFRFARRDTEAVIATLFCLLLNVSVKTHEADETASQPVLDFAKQAGQEAAGDDEENEEHGGVGAVRGRPFVDVTPE